MFRLPGHPSRSDAAGQRPLRHGQAEEACAGVPRRQTAEDLTEGDLTRSKPSQSVPLQTERKG